MSLNDSVPLGVGTTRCALSPPTNFLFAFRAKKAVHGGTGGVVLNARVGGKTSFGDDGVTTWVAWLGN